MLAAHRRRRARCRASRIQASRQGLPTIRNSPARGCCWVTTECCAITCGSETTSDSDWISEHGTPADCRTAIASPAVMLANAFPNASTPRRDVHADLRSSPDPAGRTEA